MYLFADHPELFNKPLHFDPTIFKSEDIINRFFEDYSLAELRDILWFWFEAAVTSENDQYADPTARADLLLAYQQLEELLEAVYLLHLGYKKID